MDVDHACIKVKHIRYHADVLLTLFRLFAVVDFCQTAFTGLTEAVIQIHTGLLHGTAHHIITDIPGAGQEVAEVAGVHSPHSRNGIAFNTRYLHQAANGICVQSPWKMPNRKAEVKMANFLP